MRDRSNDMTLRDVFACFALQGIVAKHGFEGRGARGRAADAYMFADSMVEARLRDPGKLKTEKEELGALLKEQEAMIKTHQMIAELFNRRNR